MTPARAWVRLQSGRRLDLLEPDPNSWTDSDLAIGLSRTYRWGGHSCWDLPLSVAQHSFLVLMLRQKLRPLEPLTRGEALRELLHDADELSSLRAFILLTLRLAGWRLTALVAWVARAGDQADFFKQNNIGKLKFMPSRTHIICMIATREGVLPVLFSATLTEPVPVFEQVALVRHMARQGYSSSQLLKISESIGRFCDWMLLGERHNSLEESTYLPDMLRRFLVARYAGTIGVDGSDPSGLSWQPVKAETVEADRRNLNRFSDFASMELGYFALNGEMRVKDFQPDGVAHRACKAILCQRRDVGLLGHLAHLRHRRSARTVGRIAPRAQPARGEFDSPSFPLSRLTDLISAEQSIAKRMLWIELAFGGVRLSKALNHYVDDVLPGRLRPKLFASDVESELPLLVIADPIASTFTGSLELSSVENRRQYLHRKYGMLPRPLRARRGDPLHAGWKGMQHDNQTLLVSQVYWSQQDWACEYWSLHCKLLEKRRSVPERVRDSHPYLYIVDSDSRSNFGAPLKIHTVEKAFARLCARIGLRPYRGKASPHGLRHAYRRQLRLLGIAPRHVQRCMHHASPESQELYDRLAPADINLALSAALSKPAQLVGQ